MTTESKRFAVSSGNGNDGVSHYWPDYIVTTDDPWALARLAAITALKPEFQAWARENVDVDGEAEFTIHAIFYNPPDDDPGEDGEDSWCDSNGAWLIFEVYDAGEASESSTCPEYDSLDSCFGADVVASLRETA